MAEDWQKGCFLSDGVINYEKPRVDTSLHPELSPAIWDARDRYKKAVACLSREEFFVIRTICCEDRKIIIPNNYPGQYKADLEQLKQFLREGLDRLCEHYWGKVALNTRRKIAGFSTVSFWDGFDDYYKNSKK